MENAQVNKKLDADNLIDSREKLLADIMNLEDDNTYKARIIKLLEKAKKDNLPNIEIYLLINDVLVDYDFNVVVPKEERQIEEKRKSELENSISAIPVYNPDDITEVAIKTRTAIGQIFLDGYNGYYRTIGVENLNMKDRKGNILTKLLGGKQKSKAKDIVSQYTEIVDRPDIGYYAIQTADIFEIPIVKEIGDGRGKRGFYKDRIIPLMIKYLLFQGNISTTIDKLSKDVGLVSKSFKNQDFESDLMTNNSQVTMFRINKFYSFCRPEQERIIFNALDSLQNDYSVITYERNFLIINSDGSERTSTKDEDITIRNVQRRILEEFGVSRIFTIYQKGRQTIKRFYSRVCDVLNDDFKFNCREYYNQIQIYADLEGLKKLDLKLNTDIEKSKQLKNEIQQHFLSKIKDRIKRDYEYNQQTADKKDAKHQKEWDENREYLENIPQDIQDLYNMGLCNESDVKSMLLPKPKPAYRYPENHIEALYYICDCLLSD